MTATISATSLAVADEPVHMGLRPLYFVDSLQDGALKAELQQCAAGTFQSSAFSIGQRGAPPQFPEHTRESYVAAALLKTGDEIRVDLNTRRVDMLIDDAELEARRAAYAPPELVHQTPWQEIQRRMVGQLSTGACLEPATLYLRVVATHGTPRHSH